MRDTANNVNTKNLYLQNKIVGVQTTAISYINNNKNFLLGNLCLSSNNMKCRVSIVYIYSNANKINNYIIDDLYRFYCNNSQVLELLRWLRPCRRQFMQKLQLRILRNLYLSGSLGKCRNSLLVLYS